MQKKFITNLAFLLFLNLLIKPFWLLGIDRTVQNVTGAAVYGEYYALFNFSFLFNILLDLGITNFNNRNISQNRQLLNKHLSGTIMLRLMLAGGYILISLIASWIIGYSVLQFQMLAILLLNQILISFILYLRSNLAGLHLFRTDSIISVLDRAIMIIICGWLLWGRMSDTPFKIEWFIWAQTIAYILTAIVTLLLLSKKTTFGNLNWNPLFAVMILKKSYPFAILILLMTFYNRIDSVMLERMLPNGSIQAGIYAQGYRLLDASNMIAYLFAGLLLPIFSHMLKHKEDIRALLRLSYLLLAVPALIVACCSYFFREQIMNLLYYEHVAGSALIFSILMIGFFAISTTYVFGTLLTSNGNLRQLNIMAGVGMVLNIGLNLILIPKFEALGAATASLITQFTTALIQVILCLRIFKLRFDFNLSIRLVIFILSIIFLTQLASELPLNWAYNLLISALGSIAMAFILNLMNIKSMIDILKSREA